MGEIGINRLEYLYDLNYIDILMIERGYNQRIYHEWSRVRWSTYYLLKATCGDEQLHKNKIFNPSDLMPLPWDKKPEQQFLSDKEQEELRQDMKMVTW